MIFYTVFPNFRDHNSELHQCFPFKTSLVFLSGPVVFISGVFDIRGYPYHSFAEPFTDFELSVAKLPIKKKHSYIDSAVSIGTTGSKSRLFTVVRGGSKFWTIFRFRRVSRPMCFLVTISITCLTG